MQVEFVARLEGIAQRMEGVLAECLATRNRPERLIEAMRYSVLGGGKRMRPFLVIESSRLFGIEGEGPELVAAAIEAVHCYSLIHDDLPAMDNDDMRRGRPTLHRAFDEATAILAGDSLLTMAFAILADRRVSPRANARARLVAALAEAAGIDGMVGGQMLDLAAEGRFLGKGETITPLGAKEIRRLQALKTGALIQFSSMAGALLAAKASKSERDALKIYSAQLGLAFQIKDDLLDVEGDAAIVGKALAKDAGAGKATFVGLLGIAGARQELDRATEKAATAMRAAFGSAAKTLNDLLEFNRERDR